ncbi:inorganic phosphate transporter [Halobacterium zhouii]|uniref:inorganic phosphate transporter n=1 Tax=Halobacterium zhouii TaxID=2902624 RepID=UPI001E59C8F4|nr:inorganic phosphate transporter [Halobacterium zhouii]
MVGSGLVTLAVAALASLFMAWAIGAGSSGSTPFAPAVGANAIPVMRAGFVVGILGFAGAVLQGANVSEAVGQELVVGVTLSPIAATVALITAAALVAIGVFTGYPIATAFTVTGAVVGTGLAMGGDPAWAKYQVVAIMWVLVPFVGGGASFGIAWALRHVDADAVLIPALGAVVGVVVASIQFAFFGPPEVSRSFARAVAVSAGQPTAVVQVAVTLAVAALVALALRRDIVGDAARGQRHFLLALGGLVAFSAGGSQVGLAIGPLLPLIQGDAIPLYVLVGGGLGLLVGSWTGAPRMIKALSQDYSSLGPRRSIAALIPSFAIAQSAVFFGIPVSFNEIIVSAIVGSGYAAATGSGVSGRKMAFTVLAWVASLVIAFVVGYVGFTAIDAVV